MCQGNPSPSAACDPMSVLEGRQCTTRHDLDVNIVTLYKNKGGRSDCSNYHSMSLLSIMGKLFARIVLKTPSTCKKGLHRIPEVHYRHGLLTETTAAEMQSRAKCYTSPSSI